MWGQITVGCRSMGSQSASMLSSEGARRAMVAELLTFTIALKNHLRDEETSRSELAAAEAARGTFSFDGSEPHDLHTLATSPSPHNRIVAALSVTIRRGLRREEDILTPPAHLWFCEQLHALTAAATACERIKSSPMPLGYVSALRFFLLLWLSTLPLAMIGSYGWSATPAVGCISFLFLNLEQVALEIEQPFGHDANDLPLEQYCAAIQKVLIGLLQP